MTDFGNVLKDALDNIDIKNLIWVSKDGTKQYMIDMSEEELSRIYNHAHDMLYNKSYRHLGKYEVKKNIELAYEKCNAELFKRYILYEQVNSRTTTIKDLLEYISSSKTSEITNSSSVSTIFPDCPNQFKSVTIDLLLNACLKNETFNKKLIGDKFILNQGIWFTEQEKEMLTEYDSNGIQRKYFDVMKERLFLNPETSLKVIPNGLSYTEFRSLLQLDNFPKINSLSTATINLLTNKIFFLLLTTVDYHIDKWEKILKDILTVAKFKGFNFVN